MIAFPISAVARRTGLPLDTLRAWERRYKAVTPARGLRGRLYSEKQIQRLIWLRQAVEQGHSIGQVASLDDRKLRKLVDGRPLTDSAATPNSYGEVSKRGDLDAKLLAPVLQALHRYDYAATDREINRILAVLGTPREFVYSAALPLMRTVGDLWHQGRSSIAQEHMLTHMLSAVLASLVRTYTPSHPPARILVATLRGNRHAFPTLVAAMLTAAAGLGVVYLGADLPSADIVLAARKSDADVVLISLSTTPDDETLEELDFIARKLRQPKALWLGGAPTMLNAEQLVARRWLPVTNFSTLEHHLNDLGKSTREPTSRPRNDNGRTQTHIQH